MRSRGTRKRCGCSSSRRSPSSASRSSPSRPSSLLKSAPGAFALMARDLHAARRVRPPLRGGRRRPARARRRRGLLFAAFRAGGSAIVAIVASKPRRIRRAGVRGLVDRRRQPARARTADAASRSPAILGIYAIGVLAVAAGDVRPVPRAVRGVVRSRAAFAASGVAFAQNTLPLVVVRRSHRCCCSCFGLLTAGLGLVLALPLSAASSYAAWKDVFGVRDAPASDARRSARSSGRRRVRETARRRSTAVRRHGRPLRRARPAARAGTTR